MKMDRYCGKQPAVSVIIPLYNKERDVARAIGSALAQTFADFEVIVVNDGSTDGGSCIVAAFSDPRMRMVHQRNAGVSAARNRGIADARSGLIAFLDADDEWKPEFLETIMRLQSLFPSCEVFATSYMLREATGICRAASIRGIPSYPHEGILADYFHVAAHSDPPICSSSVAVTRKALMAIGGFPAGISSGEDLLTWARLASRYAIAYSTFPVAVFWMPADVNARPERFKSHEDVVGLELAALLETAPAPLVRSIREYLARWHEMRAVIFLQLQDRGNCLKEILTVMRYSRPNGKLALLSLLACLPAKVSAPLYNRLRKMRDRSRIVIGGAHGAA